MFTPWQVRFLGELSAEQGGRRITRFRSQKTATLFAYLCLHAHRDHGREELIDLFWPDEELDAGRNNLRVALWALRKALEPAPTPAGSVLLTTRTHARIRPTAVRTDVAAFEAAVKARDWQLARDLSAAGAFLPGVYDEWALQERERLEVIREGLEAHAEEAREASGGEAAIGDAVAPHAATLLLPNNLPLTTDRFLGRDEEVTRLEMLLLNPAVRLVTLMGMGGAGKTRLAVETAHRLLEDKASAARALLTGGIWFVPLATVTDAAGLAEALPARLRDALGLPADPRRQPLAQVTEALAGKRALFGLDNLEQVVEGAPEIIPLLLDKLPGATFLTTSRVRLGLPGERVLAVRPLALPEPDATVDDLAGNAAVALFADRARAVEIDFTLTGGNAGDVAALVRLLEGLPLALELAAAWANVLTPRQMREQLEGMLHAVERLDAFPARRPVGREARHRSLRATFQWSYELLPAEERRVLARLSVFRGGFNAETVAAVCQVARPQAILARLHQHSLVAASPSPDGTEVRFSLLESLREFAEAQLNEDERAALAAEHIAHFLNRAEQARRLHGTPEAARGIDLLERERGNLYAALDRLKAQIGVGETALCLAASLHWLWVMRGPLDEGQRYVAEVLARPDAQAATRARADALNTLGGLAIFQRDMEEARARYTESLRLCRELGYTEGLVAALGNLATTLMDAGDRDTARPLFEEALALARETGNQGREAVILYNLGNLAHWRRDLTGAACHHTASLAIRRERGDLRGVAVSLQALALLAMEQGDYEAAIERMREGMRLSREMGDRSHLDTTLENFARAEEGHGRYERGACLRAAAEALRQASHISLPPIRRQELDREYGELRERLGEATLTAAWETGSALTEEQAINLTLE